MDKTFDEAIAGIRKAERGVEVREDIAQGMEYVAKISEACEKQAALATSSAATAQSAASTSTAKADEATRQAKQAKADREKAQAAASTAASDVADLLKGYTDSALASKEAATASQTAAKASANAAQKHQTGAEAAQKKAEDAADRAAAIVSTDKTLSIPDAPADAKATGDALADKLSLSGGTMTGPLIMPGGGSVLSIEDNAATHNMVYRGKALGASVTSEQWAAIKAGTFKDLYLGDYWSIGGVDYLIAAFNYWLSYGDTACTTNHLLVVPRNGMYTAKMNDTNITTGGYVGSDMYKNGLARAKTTISNAFGSAHILKHRQHLVNAVTNGAPAGTDWYDSTVELMNENMVYGGRQLSPMPNGATDPLITCRNYTIDKSQLPLFRLAPWLICNRQWYWLRDIISATGFAVAGTGGNSAGAGSTGDAYVRPVVGLIG